jgi:hypothetical protein
MTEAPWSVVPVVELGSGALAIRDAVVAGDRCDPVGEVY